MKDWNRLFSEEDKQGPTNMLNVSNQKGNPDENFIPIKMTIIEKKCEQAFEESFIRLVEV